MKNAKGDSSSGLERATFEFTSRGTQCLLYDGHFYSRNKTFENGTRVNWKCRFYHRLHCKARAQTRLIGGVEYVKVFKNEHSHPQEVKSMRRRKRKIKLSFSQHHSATAAHTVVLDGAVTLANFSLTQRGRPLLVHDGYTYIRNGEFADTINWRCSMHRRLRCKAKAITEKRYGKEYVRLSHPEHNHRPKRRKVCCGHYSDEFVAMNRSPDAIGGHVVEHSNYYHDTGRHVTDFSSSAEPKFEPEEDEFSMDLME
uniref:FLYWCH-type domain-containing protein n=1 Tax=Anopheles farauti TaxID=69004 RepID=A0A182QHJ4_9DIPT